MEGITKKEIALIILGVVLFCCPFLWLLHSDPRKGDFSAFNMSKLAIGYRIIGWAWAAIGSIAFTFSVASVMSCQRARKTSHDGRVENQPL